MKTTFESGGIDIRQGNTTTRHKLLLELVFARDVKDMVGEHYQAPTRRASSVR